LFDRRELAQVWKLRRVLLALESGNALELLIDRLKSTKSNEEFLVEVAKSGG
jgi:transcription termination factor Rho